MQTDLQKIVSIAGQSGLYKYLSEARHGVIVESIKDGKRTCVPSSLKLSSLSDITVFTENEDDLMLKDIFLKIKEKTGGEQAISHKLPREELMAFFEDVVPEYSKDKVFPHHVKKMIEWYNILQEYNLLDFAEPEKKETDNSQNEEDENDVSET
jgi:hypothetical protein